MVRKLKMNESNRWILSDTSDDTRMIEIKRTLDIDMECECSALEAKQFIKFLVSNYNGKLVDYDVEQNGRTDKFIIRANGRDYIIGINSEGFIWVK